MSYDMTSLQDLSARLQQIRTPLRDASSSLPAIGTSASYQALRFHLTQLDQHLEELNVGIDALIGAMTTNQRISHAVSDAGAEVVAFVRAETP